MQIELEVNLGVETMELYEYNKIIEYNRRNCDAVLSKNNEVEIFVDGIGKFNRLNEDLKNARKYIFIQYYIIKDDEVFNDIADILIEKAKKGVLIYVLYDAVGCRRMKKRRWKPLKALGINVACFSNGLNSGINNRNHRKIVVIDGEIAYSGGINIGREYIGRDKKFGNWRDTHFRILGETVGTLAKSFIEDWNDLAKSNIIKNKEDFIFNSSSVGDCYMQAVTGGPFSNSEIIRDNYLMIIESAKDYIYIQTPYFIPDKDILDALKNASKSGVKVVIMIPCKPDHPFVYWATLSYVGELLLAGAKGFLYNDGFLHSKGIISDGKICSFGSANMDITSFKLNYEVNLVIYDKKTVEQLVLFYKNDLKHCREITIDEYKKQGVIIKIKERIFRLMSDVL